MAGGVQQQTPSVVIQAAAATKQRNWSRRSQDWNDSACVIAPPDCPRRWPAGGRRRIANRPLQRDGARPARAESMIPDKTLEEASVVDARVSEETDTVSTECDDDDFCADADAPTSVDVVANNSKERKHVTFDTDAVTLHPIPPYAEIYGLHPREFNFDKRYFMIPTGCALTSIGLSAVDKDGADNDDDDAEEDSDSEDEANEIWEVIEDVYRLAEPLD